MLFGCHNFTVTSLDRWGKVKSCQTKVVSCTKSSAAQAFPSLPFPLHLHANSLKMFQESSASALACKMLINHISLMGGCDLTLMKTLGREWGQELGRRMSTGLRCYQWKPSEWYRCQSFPHLLRSKVSIGRIIKIPHHILWIVYIANS